MNLPLTTNLRHSVTNWDSTDSEEQFRKNWDDPNTRKKLIKLGYDETSITYVSDRYGFRNPIGIDWNSVDKLIMTLGCSFTFGTGLALHQIWPTLLADKLDSRVFNAGVPGASADNTFRIAKEMIPKYKPYAVFHFVAQYTRTEIISPLVMNGLPYQYGPWDYNNTEFLGYSKCINNEVSLKLQQERNRLAIAQICHLNDVKYVDFLSKDKLSYKKTPADHKARDLQHPGKLHHVAIADKMYNLYRD